jgi:indole-3-glycerol phosphate synthase
MASILSEIIAHKRAEVAALKRRVTRQAPGVARGVGTGAGVGFRDAIASGPGISLIAEIKRRSPTAGEIRPDLDPVEIAAIYEDSGAAAISCLTDQRFFGGSLEDLEAVKSKVAIPVLMKDFVIDEYQIAEARSRGADAVLLIVAALDESELGDLIEAAGSYGLDALVEVHDAQEVQVALRSGASLIGVNNRDLHTFETNLETSLKLAEALPSDIVKISESGIRTRDDILRLEAAGLDGFLVGEALMRSGDIAAKVKELLGRG